MDRTEFRTNDFGYFIISVLLYLCIVFGIFLKLSLWQEPKKFTDSRDACMDVVIIEREPSSVIKAPEKQKEIAKEPELQREPDKNIEEPKKDTTVKSSEPISQPELKSEPIKELVIKKEDEISKDEQVKPKKEEKQNLQDLFKSIDTKKLKQDNVSKNEPNKEQSRKKPEKSQDSTLQKKASDVINALSLDKVAKTPKSQMTGEYNEYLGLISRILKQEWSIYKANTFAKAIVTVIINMDGSFEYNIEKLSSDNEFNDKVRDFLQKMTFKKFPPPTKLGKVLELTINIEDKLE